jgi:photosystem II stability/assembly factor-like uncharacterized protein
MTRFAGIPPIAEPDLPEIGRGSRRDAALWSGPGRRFASAVAVSSTLVSSAIAAATFAAAPVRAQQARTQARPPAAAIDTGSLGQLQYRYIGPEGNRADAVAGVPGDALTFYAGAASGGVWKTTDGGVHWSPIFDEQNAQSIGSLAVAPSDPNIVWAGTGEPFIRSHISLGNGIYRSTDAGKTWMPMGLERTGRLARIAIDPSNPDIVLVAAQGHSYGPQPERGVFRTLDGGRTWERVLFVNDSTGAIDVVMDPTNPRILYAATWQLAIHTWGRESGGPGSGIWKSTDGGTTWKRLTGHGLPEHPMGKIGLAVAASDPDRVYALIETGDGVPWHGEETDTGELWRSDDAGDTWRMVTADRDLTGRGAYYTRMAVMPDDEDEAYFLSAAWSKTLDGGEHIISFTTFDQVPGGDHHDIWIDPTDGNRMIVSHDGGVSITQNRGRSWFRVQLPIAQIYHVTVDNAIPYRVYGNRQDGPSAMGPSNSRYGIIPRAAWTTVGGGESGWATPDTVDDNIVWSSASGFGSVSGIVSRYDRRTQQIHTVEVWPEPSIGRPAKDVKYRFVWTFPLTISPNDHNRVYVGSQYVHVTTDGGNSWSVISPDLTRNDTSRMGISGGLTPDNIGVEYSGVVFAIAESPIQAGLIWAGTNDGKVHVTRDAGATWEDLTANLPGLPDWGTIANIEPSRWNAGTAYLSVDGHQAGNFDPWLYRTSDFGRTWKLIVDGIPKSTLSYTHIIREDPVRRGLLYAGTENGLYASFDDGDHWQPLQMNLPHSPVYWLTVQPHFNDLVVATYGRGFWILDDLTPLQQATPQVLASDAHLFAPRPAYRFRGIEGPYTPDADPTVGQNPTYGASIHFWLKSAPAKPDSSIDVRIADATGKVLRTIRTTPKQGINRVWWDLNEDASKTVKMRTSPRFATGVRVGDDGTRASPDIAPVSLLVPPGTYTVRVTLAGTEFTQPLQVLKDPNSDGTVQTIAQQQPVLHGLRDDLDNVADMVNGLELVRAQLQTLVRTLAADSTAGAAGSADGTNKDLRAAADSLGEKLMDVESELAQLRQTGRGQDVIRWPMMLGAQINYLSGDVGSSDFAPTTQQQEVARILHERAQAVRARFDAMIKGEVASFNDLLRRRGIGGLVSVVT